jgi:hypothetical protein
MADVVLEARLMPTRTYNESPQFEVSALPHS